MGNLTQAILKEMAKKQGQIDKLAEMFKLARDVEESVTPAAEPTRKESKTRSYDDALRQDTLNKNRLPRLIVKALQSGKLKLDRNGNINSFVLRDFADRYYRPLEHPQAAVLYAMERIAYAMKWEYVQKGSGYWVDGNTLHNPDFD